MHYYILHIPRSAMFGTQDEIMPMSIATKPLLTL